jgi:hypothetical protein
MAAILRAAVAGQPGNLPDCAKLRDEKTGAHEAAYDLFCHE